MGRQHVALLSFGIRTPSAKRASGPLRTASPLPPGKQNMN